ncbi:MAG: M24 family metallopeptidase [Eubacteriales bacterium]
MKAINKIRNWLKENNFDGVILNRRDNFSWITGGKRNYVLMSSEFGIGFIVVKKDCIDLLADNIDASRLHDEEIPYKVNVISYPWYESRSRFITNYIGDKVFASDIEMPGTICKHNELVNLRMLLTEEEVSTYRKLGTDCADIVEEVCFDAQRQQKENDIATRLKKLSIERGINADCILVGGDERIDQYRHPMPTNQSFSKKLMVVLGAERDGLYTSITRMVHFGPLSKELIDKYNKVQLIFATMQMMMKHNLKYSDYFKSIQEIYADVGYDEEWKKHHQGGPTGYACREQIINPDSLGTIKNNQAYAWNPTITGVKCEETSILHNNQPEILTNTKRWPRTLINTGYGKCFVSDILLKS